jgi:hypothetical protein
VVRAGRSAPSACHRTVAVTRLPSVLLPLVTDSCFLILPLLRYLHLPRSSASVADKAATERVDPDPAPTPAEAADAVLTKTGGGPEPAAAAVAAAGSGATAPAGPAQAAARMLTLATTKGLPLLSGAAVLAVPAVAVAAVVVWWVRGISGIGSLRCTKP